MEGLGESGGTERNKERNSDLAQDDNYKGIRKAGRKEGSGGKNGEHDPISGEGRARRRLAISCLKSDMGLLLFSSSLQCTSGGVLFSRAMFSFPALLFAHSKIPYP